MLSDGHLVVPAGVLADNVAEAEVKSFLAARARRARPRPLPHQRCAGEDGRRLRPHRRRLRRHLGADAGKLADSLEAAGIKPEQIGKVVLTHAHPDHIWGLVDELDDSLRFPRAQYVVAAREFDFWTSGEAASLTGPIEGIAAGARRVFKAIEARTTRIKPGDEVAPGIAAIDTAGHTPATSRCWSPPARTSCSSPPMPCRTRTSRSRIPTGIPAPTWTASGLPKPPPPARHGGNRQAARAQLPHPVSRAWPGGAQGIGVHLGGRRLRRAPSALAGYLSEVGTTPGASAGPAVFQAPQ